MKSARAVFEILSKKTKLTLTEIEKEMGYKTGSLAVYSSQDNIPFKSVAIFCDAHSLNSQEIIFGKEVEKPKKKISKKQIKNNLKYSLARSLEKYQERKNRRIDKIQKLVKTIDENDTIAAAIYSNLEELRSF